MMNKAIYNTLYFTKRFYQTSQLFPVIVSYDKKCYGKYIEIFNELILSDNRISYNIQEAEKAVVGKPIYHKNLINTQYPLY